MAVVLMLECVTLCISEELPALLVAGVLSAIGSCGFVVCAMVMDTTTYDVGLVTSRMAIIGTLALAFGLLGFGVGQVMTGTDNVHDAFLLTMVLSWVNLFLTVLLVPETLRNSARALNEEIRVLGLGFLRVLTTSDIMMYFAAAIGLRAFAWSGIASVVVPFCNEKY